MSPLEARLVRRLVYAPETLSRNRNFHTFNDAIARRARRTAAHLRSIRRAVAAEGATVTAEHIERRWVLTIVDTEHDVLRTAHLSEAELDILRDDPVVDDLIREMETALEVDLLHVDPRVQVAQPCAALG